MDEGCLNPDQSIVSSETKLSPAAGNMLKVELNEQIVRFVCRKDPSLFKDSLDTTELNSHETVNTFGSDPGVDVAKKKGSMVCARTAATDVVKCLSTSTYTSDPTHFNLPHVTPKTCTRADDQIQLGGESCFVPRKLKSQPITPKTPATDVNCCIVSVKPKIAPRKLFGSPYSTGTPVNLFNRNAGNHISTGTRIEVHSRLPEISRAVVDKCVQKTKVNTASRKLGSSPGIRKTIGTDLASEILVPKLNEVITQLNVSSTIRKNVDFEASREVSKLRTNSILTQLYVFPAALRDNYPSECKTNRSRLKTTWFPRDNFSFSTSSISGKNCNSCNSNLNPSSKSDPWILSSVQTGTSLKYVGPGESWAKFCDCKNTDNGLQSNGMVTEPNCPYSFASTPSTNVDKCQPSQYFKPEVNQTLIPIPPNHLKASVSENQDRNRFRTEIRTKLSDHSENPLQPATEFPTVGLSNRSFACSNVLKSSDQSTYNICSGTLDRISSTITKDPYNCRSPYSRIYFPKNLSNSSSLSATFSNALDNQLCSAKNSVRCSSKVSNNSEKPVLKEIDMKKRVETSDLQDDAGEIVEHFKYRVSYLVEIHGNF